MEDEFLSLRWNNHRTTFFQVLSTLREKEQFTDATLACEGKFFPVHKLVLSTCSDYFNEIFVKTPCKAPFIVLKDIRQNELESILDYMYLGEVDVRQADLSNLIKAAECLQIKGLSIPDEPSADTGKRHLESSPKRNSGNKRRKQSYSENFENSTSDFTAKLHSAILSQKVPLLPFDTIKIEHEENREEKPPQPQGHDENVDDSVKNDSDDIFQSAKTESGDFEETSNDNAEFEKLEGPTWDDPGSSHQLRVKDNSNNSTDAYSGSRSEAGRSKYRRTKIHSCPYCAYRTSSTTHLRYHIRTHTGERPFACPSCSYKASRKSNLKVHMITHQHDVVIHQQD